MGRPRHKHAPLAQYLYVERGMTDLEELSRLTGIKVKTLEHYRASLGWIDLQQAHEQGRDSQIQSLDDVADSMIRLLLHKAEEYQSIPVEMVDADVLKGLKNLVETVKLLTSELRRMGKRDKLLVARDITDHVLLMDAEAPLDPAALNTVFEVIGNYCDTVLDGNTGV